MKILQTIVTASTLVIGSSLFAQDAKPAAAPAAAPTAAGQAAPAAPAEGAPATLNGSSDAAAAGEPLAAIPWPDSQPGAKRDNSWWVDVPTSFT